MATRDRQERHSSRAETRRSLIGEALKAQGRSDAAVAAFESIDSAMFQFHRRMAKGLFARMVIARFNLDLEIAEFQGLTAIARMQLGIGGSEIREATIGDLAEELAIDPSRASRIAALLVRKGLLRRGISQDDARKSVLGLSPAGLAIMAAIGKFKWQKTAEGMADWQDSELVAFAGLFARYAAASQALIETAPPVPAPEAADIAAAIAAELALREPAWQAEPAE